MLPCLESVSFVRWVAVIFMLLCLGSDNFMIFLLAQQENVVLNHIS
jgi:hypothetical protein